MELAPKLAGLVSGPSSNTKKLLETGHKTPCGSNIYEQQVKMELHSPSQSYAWTFRRIVWATLMLVSIMMGFWLFYRFYEVIFILFVAIVIGTVLRPAIAWLHQRGLPRIAGVILVYFLLLILLVGFLLLLFPLIAVQGATIATAVPGYYQSLREWMGNDPNQLVSSLNGLLPVTLPGLMPIQQTGGEMLASAWQVWGYVILAARIIFMAIVILVLVFHWTLEGPKVIQSLLPLVPKSQRESTSELISSHGNQAGFLCGRARHPMPGHRDPGTGCLSAYWPAKCPGASTRGGRSGGSSDDWARAGRHSCGCNRFIHFALQIGLGDRCHTYYSATRKQSAGAAHHAEGCGGRSVRLPARDFCLQLLVRHCGRARWQFPWRPLFNSCSIALFFIQHHGSRTLVVIRPAG